MRILLLANKEQRDELIGQQAPGGIILEWRESIDQLPKIASTDIIIDLIYNESDAHEQWLKSINAELVIVNAVVKPVASKQFVRINGWTSFLRRSIVEAATINDQLQKQTELVFAQFGKTVEWLPDETGFIVPRVVASIINEAYFALEEGVSSKYEIDIAMKLGTNYPYGPFEWCEKIGATNIVSLLSSLATELPRYRPARLLIEEANR